MASRIVQGRDKTKDSVYWTIILDKKDAIALPTDDWKKLTEAIATIEHIYKEFGSDSKE